MNARQPLDLAATNPQAIERAAQAWSDRLHDAAFSGHEALDELSFQQLLDLQDEASEDDSFDTFNDVSRELRDRRSDAKVALVKLFFAACDSFGTIPQVIGGKLGCVLISVYLTEAMGTIASTSQAVRLLLAPADRAEIIGALAAEYANENAEDLLRAGWQA